MLHLFVVLYLGSLSYTRRGFKIGLPCGFVSVLFLTFSYSISHFVTSSPPVLVTTFNQNVLAWTLYSYSGALFDACIAQKEKQLY